MFGITKKHFHKDWKETVKALWNFWSSPTGAFLLGVSGIAAGYYIFYISKPILKYETETVTFISSENDNQYSVLVGDKNYSDLYMTRVYLRNKGAEALSGNDVSKIGHDPIRIVASDDAKIVHHTLDKTATTKAISADLKKADNDLVIEFDYLNPDYQIAVSLLHENPQAQFSIQGSALNVNEITKEWDIHKINFWGFGGLGLLYLILIAFYVYHHWYKRKIF